MLCRFDSIIYMDDKNKQAIYEAAQHWKVPTDKVKPRVKSMMSVSLPSVFTVCVFCVSFLLLSLSLYLTHSLTHICICTNTLGSCRAILSSHQASQLSSSKHEKNDPT
jgi:hypothetical protein